MIGGGIFNFTLGIFLFTLWFYSDKKAWVLFGASLWLIGIGLGGFIAGLIIKGGS